MSRLNRAALLFQDHVKVAVSIREQPLFVMADLLNQNQKKLS